MTHAGMTQPMTSTKEHTLYLELKRARLVRELRRVNQELRQRAPAEAGGKWDFDPRALECAKP